MNEESAYNPKLRSVLREAFRGKAVSRTLTNLFWRGRVKLQGSILDIGGAGRGSHFRFLDIANDSSFKVVDIVPKKGVDFALDITIDSVPLPDGSQDFVLMFNILEHLYNHAFVLSEVRRLLRPGGKLIGTIPFLVNVHPDPNDYIRFTEQGLSELFTKNGFTVETIVPIGRGPFLAAFEQLDILLFQPLYTALVPVIWALDRVLQMPRSRDLKAQFPVAYNFIVEKAV